MEFLMGLHSGVRWLVVAAALFALVWYALVWARRVSNERVDRIAMLIFTILLDVQVVIGIILLLAAGLVGFRIEHGVTMLIAALAAHLSMRWRKAEATIRARNNALLIIAVMAVVFIGVARLPQGWFG